jgi:predicted KAP-like P-loop ATPase
LAQSQAILKQGDCGGRSDFRLELRAIRINGAVMWSDNETDRDFLNFAFVAEIASEIIVQAQGRPLSMGISGSWGVGKSSMMKLLAKSLRDRSGERFLFVEFSAWRYQSYDDTRAALMEVIARAILEKIESEQTVADGILEKAKGLIKRVNWFRLASVSASTVAALAVGLPPLGLVGEGVAAVKSLTDGRVTKEDFEGAQKVAAHVRDAGLLNEKKDNTTPETPPKEIQEFRNELKDTLHELGLTLVVLIDDLDRCLPQTAIATLEAMHLFLFMDRTAFIIAADDEMIRRAVRSHFSAANLTEDLVTNYFDKLIQVPIRVPPLGTQDVRAYLMLLFIENSTLTATDRDRDRVREQICARLSETWSGKRIDRPFVDSLIGVVPAELAQQLDIADRLAPILTRSSKIAGNPRLIKRFLNTLAIRKAIAKAQKVNLDEAALTKMLLFERCGSERAYAQLVAAINESDEGKPEFLKELEVAAVNGPEVLKLDGEWNTDFVREWLTLDPPLAEVDLRGVVYVSRERIPVISSADRLSSEAAAILEALVKLTSQNPAVGQKLRELSAPELALVTERILTRARAVEQWGIPPILNAMLLLAGVEGPHVGAIARFLQALPPSRITPAIVPLLADKQWANEVLSTWAESPDAPAPVKRAIASADKKKTARVV